MGAEPVDPLPRRKNWLYEPTYDGFRLLAFRFGDEVHLQSPNRRACCGPAARVASWLPCQPNASHGNGREPLHSTSVKIVG